jgi:DNA-binding FadR family transcriptional regulator
VNVERHVGAPAGSRRTGSDSRTVDGHEDRKRGEEVAWRIESDIIAAGRPEGEVFGSENQLLDRYGVSRAVLREAVRVVEYLGVARMRRGPGGGLVITKPDASGVITAVMVYLTFQQARLEEVLDVRTPLEEATARLAAQRRSERDLELLREQVALEHAFGVGDDIALHRKIAGITGNPAFELFVEILARISIQYRALGRMGASRQRQAVAETLRTHDGIVSAIGAGDADAAARRAVRHLDRARHFLTARQLDRTPGFAQAINVGADEVALAPSVARRIYSEIVARGWPVSELLGSEADLMAQHAVSRTVLRAALRLLEFNRIVRTRRGPGGGVFVAAPSQEATVDAMAVYLESRGITPQHLFEVRQAVELAAVDMTVAALDEHGVAVLEAALEVERSTDEVRHIGHQLHEHIAELTGNRVLPLFLNALTRLAEMHTQTPETGLGLTAEEAAANMRRIHGQIVDAIVSGDRAVARRRMERHLAALMPMQR